ncbi:MAG: inorganic diphosphatase [Anaeromyxobacter sp.]
MRDDKGEDDKIIAVHADDPNYSDYTDVSELPPHRLRELQRFFQDYKALENKKVLVSEPQGRSEALQVLRDASRLYNRERGRLMQVSGGEPPPPPAPERSRRAAAPARGRKVPARKR